MKRQEIWLVTKYSNNGGKNPEGQRYDERTYFSREQAEKWTQTHQPYHQWKFWFTIDRYVLVEHEGWDVT